MRALTALLDHARDIVARATGCAVVVQHDVVAAVLAEARSTEIRLVASRAEDLLGLGHSCPIRGWRRYARHCQLHLAARIRQAGYTDFARIARIVPSLNLLARIAPFIESTLAGAGGLQGWVRGEG